MRKVLAFVFGLVLVFVALMINPQFMFRWAWVLGIVCLAILVAFAIRRRYAGARAR